MWTSSSGCGSGLRNLSTGASHSTSSGWPLIVMPRGMLPWEVADRSRSEPAPRSLLGDQGLAAIPRVPGGATVGVELCDFHERRELIIRTVVVGYWVPGVLSVGTLMAVGVRQLAGGGNSRRLWAGNCKSPMLRANTANRRCLGPWVGHVHEGTKWPVWAYPS